MKEIKNKIKDSIFGDFNQELIGDKAKLQNKVNKLQRMIDMINYLQPIEEKQDFVLPNSWAVKDCEKVSEYASKRFNCSNSVSSDGWFLNVNEYNNNYQFKSLIIDGYTEITFEQFKKYVLNEK